jgi:adenosylhomocysteine nucleosidase
MFAPEPGCGAKRPSLPAVRSEVLVGIVTAMPEEFEAVAKVVSNGRRLRAPRQDRRFLLEGKIAGVPVLLGMTGDGVARASASVSFLLREFPVSLLVGAGAAGALVPSLRAGDVVVAERLVDEEGDGPLPDTGLVSRAEVLGAKPATVVTVSRLICSSREKRDLASRFGYSDSAPAVVDTESAAWGRAASACGVPFVILRAVSDIFEEDLPGFLSSCRTVDGSVNRAAVARKLIRHPGALPPLLRARERVREGAGKVGLFLERALSEKI